MIHLVFLVKNSCNMSNLTIFNLQVQDSNNGSTLGRLGRCYQCYFVPQSSIESIHDVTLVERSCKIANSRKKINSNNLDNKNEFVLGRIEQIRKTFFLSFS